MQEEEDENCATKTLPQKQESKELEVNFYPWISLLINLPLQYFSVGSPGGPSKISWDGLEYGDIAAFTQPMQKKDVRSTWCTPVLMMMMMTRLMVMMMTMMMMMKGLEYSDIAA